MTIKISGKYKGKTYYHAERKVVFDRISSAIGWPGERPGFLVVIGEKEIDRQIHRFVLAESTASSFGELLNDAVKLQTRFDLKRWHSIHVPGSENYIDIFNKKAFNSGGQRLAFIDEPIESNDYIQTSIEVILDSVRSGQKNLHFFNDSSLPAELQGLPGNTSKLKIVDYPAVAALGFVISYMEEFKKPSVYISRANSAY